MTTTGNTRKRWRGDEESEEESEEEMDKRTLAGILCWLVILMT